jgi:hypothetical protein
LHNFLYEIQKIYFPVYLYYNELVPGLQKARGAQGIVGARSGRASGGTPEKPGFCRAKMRTIISCFNFGTGPYIIISGRSLLQWQA